MMCGKVETNRFSLVFRNSQLSLMWLRRPGSEKWLWKSFVAFRTKFFWVLPNFAHRFDVKYETGAKRWLLITTSLWHTTLFSSTAIRLMQTWACNSNQLPHRRLQTVRYFSPRDRYIYQRQITSFQTLLCKAARMVMEGGGSLLSPCSPQPRCCHVRYLLVWKQSAQRAYYTGSKKQAGCRISMDI